MPNLIVRIFRKLFPPSAQDIEIKLKQYKESNIYPRVMSCGETIDLLLAKNMSIARYGDGEYNLCFNKPLAFQDADAALAKRLREILGDSKNPHCLVAIMEYRVDRLTSFWKQYWYENLPAIAAMLDRNTVYGNMAITRESDLPQLMRVKEIWTGKRGIFVVGKNSRFDYVPELFGNLKEHVYVYGPARNAWSDYKNILEETIAAVKGKENESMVIISLGPTATVLAYDLAQLGIQALDVGHIANVYNMLANKGKLPEELPIEKNKP